MKNLRKVRRSHDIMSYFDVTSLSNPIDESLAKRLGFKRIFNNGIDVEVTLSIPKKAQNPILLSSSSQSAINQCLQNENVTGIINTGDEIGAKSIEKLVQKEKLIVFDAYSMTGSSERLASINKAKKAFRYVSKMHADLAIASFAPSNDYLLSYMQLFEIAKLIGASDAQAKLMLSRIGMVLS